jgi:hypothetical protein
MRLTGLRQEIERRRCRWLPVLSQKLLFSADRITVVKRQPKLPFGSGAEEEWHVGWAASQLLPLTGCARWRLRIVGHAGDNGSMTIAVGVCDAAGAHASGLWLGNNDVYRFVRDGDGRCGFAGESDTFPQGWGVNAQRQPQPNGTGLAPWSWIPEFAVRPGGCDAPTLETRRRSRRLNRSAAAQEVAIPRTYPYHSAIRDCVHRFLEIELLYDADAGTLSYGSSSQPDDQMCARFVGFAHGTRLRPWVHFPFRSDHCLPGSRGQTVTLTNGSPQVTLVGWL